MYFLAAPFIISGLVLKIYNNRKKRQIEGLEKPNEQFNKTQSSTDNS
jgi:preprotein translocase subunit SecG